MSAVLIAVILALVLGHTVPPLAALRRYEPFHAWIAWLGAQLGSQGGYGSRYAILLSLGLPLLLVGALQWLLQGQFYGLPAFLFALLVLFWSWGPRDLDLDVEAIVTAGDLGHRRSAAATLFDGAEPASLDGASLVGGVFRNALERWFGVLLWFVLLGPVGAVLYRLAQLGASPRLSASLPLEHAAAYQRLRTILDWPAAQLMTLGLALAANFDAVVGAWRAWHAERGEGWLVLDTGFLDAAGRASVDAEVAEELDEGYAPDAPPPPAPALPALRDAISLVWRVLLLWLAVLALFVLAGYVN